MTMPVRRILQYAIPIAAFVLLGAWLASVPLYRGYSMEQCRRAYDRAVNRDDTARVDLHPYRVEVDDGVRRRCGEIRAVTATDSIPSLEGARRAAVSADDR